MGCKSSKIGCLPVVFAKKKNCIVNRDVVEVHLAREGRTVTEVLSTTSSFLSTTKSYITVNTGGVAFQMEKQIKVEDTPVVDIVSEGTKEHDEDDSLPQGSDNESSSAYGESDHTDDELDFEEKEISVNCSLAEDSDGSTPNTRGICKSRLIIVKPKAMNSPIATFSETFCTEKNVTCELQSQSHTPLPYVPRIIRTRPKAAKGSRNIVNDRTATPLETRIQDFENNVQKLVDRNLLEPLKMDTRDVRFRPKAARGPRAICMPLNTRAGMVMPTYNRNNTRVIRPHLTVKGFNTPQDDCLSAWMERQQIKDTFGNG